MSRKARRIRDDDTLVELDTRELDQVNGGWGAGAYISGGITFPGFTANVSVTIGTDGVHLYGSVGPSLGDAGQVSGSVGGWATKGDSSTYFSGPSDSGSVGLKEGLDLSVEGGVSHDINGVTGVAGGLQFGLAGSPTVVGGNIAHTEGVQLDGAVNTAVNAVNNYLNPTPGNGAPGDTYVPASTNPDGSINPGHFEAPSTDGQSPTGDASHQNDPSNGNGQPTPDQQNDPSNEQPGYDPNSNAYSNSPQNDNTYGDFPSGGSETGNGGGGDPSGGDPSGGGGGSYDGGGGSYAGGDGGGGDDGGGDVSDA